MGQEKEEVNNGKSIVVSRPNQELPPSHLLTELKLLLQFSESIASKMWDEICLFSYWAKILHRSTDISVV